ncbi:Uncharacterized protein PECH_003373 [Penicillium ucsense]|uniref:Uncharacterized protein n=1 Tax=Penicillium ucsense TaxID=2839758 RepID=A0A8J8W8T9_9EURO|nr:Uncharacterized protein PECM_000183 [Penicillium ucsense]KAF7739398.1 Uncharacterized protein PECH_003373 [Penicillium ucsense]
MADQARPRPAWMPPTAELAFAMAIVKLKPVGISVKDHIFAIRENVKKVDDSKPHLSDKFWDSAAHWRNAFLKSENEQTTLHNRIFELEQKNTELNLKLNIAGPSLKREIEDFEVELTTARKRSKKNEPNAYSRDYIRFHHTYKGVSFLRHMVILTRALQVKRVKRDKMKILAAHSADLCKQAERGVLTVIQSQIETMLSLRDPQPWKYKEPNFGAVVKAVEMSWLLLQQVLVKTKSPSDASDPRKQVVYFMVCLFESIATALAQYCKALAKVSIVMPCPAASKKKQTKNAFEPSEDRSGTEYVLTGLLASLARSLDLSEEPCRAVLEGMLYVIANRVGQMLAFYSFDGMALPHLSIPDLKPPRGLEEMQRAGMTPEWAEIEARQLVLFLRKISITGNCFSADRFTGNRSQADMRKQMQTKMTNQLLTAVFGEAEPDFHNRLIRAATPPPNDHVTPKDDSSTFKEWFVQHVWHLIGWECLAKMETDTA